MIKLQNIHKYYAVGHNKLHVLKGIDTIIEEGELVPIMGSSGSGKSTLLNILGILDDYDSGDYYLAGAHIRNLSQTKAAYYRNRFLGFVFQSFNLLSFKNAMENVALPLYYQKVGRCERNKLALEYLDRVGLLDWAEHSPNELSGGQRQRVAIARALISKPKLILADEPTGAIEGRTFKAKLEYIAPKGITEEGAIKFQVRAKVLLDPKDFIRAGYSANADIVLDQKENVLALKESLLQFGKGKDSTYVEIETAPQQFKKQLVKTGISDGINIEVVSGISKDNKVKVKEPEAPEKKNS